VSELPPGEYIVVGGDIDRVSASVRAGGDELDPDEITRAFGVQPSFAARKGDVRLSGGREVRQRTGIWLLNFGGAPEEWTLSDAISELLDRLPADLSVWTHLGLKYQLDVFCGLHISAWNRGFEIVPSVLRRLAERSLSLSVDIYCEGSADQAT